MDLYVTKVSNAALGDQGLLLLWKFQWKVELSSATKCRVSFQSIQTKLSLPAPYVYILQTNTISTELNDLRKILVREKLKFLLKNFNL